MMASAAVRRVEQDMLANLDASEQDQMRRLLTACITALTEPPHRRRNCSRLGQPGTYAATMARLGYSEREITQMSDRLMDGMVMPTATELSDGIGQLEQLAPTLAGLTS
jgi:hypothetical protein